MSIGKVRGILTAAHVLAHLPNQGKVGTVEYVGGTPHFRKRKIKVTNTTKIVLRKDEFGPEGPDLGFLRLSPDTIGWFEALGTFYNLLKHLTDANGPPPTPDHTDAVVGMIKERTKDYPAERAGERRKGFEALVSNGTASNVRTSDGFKLFDFAPTTYPDFKLPGDYRGTSGGAVWRIFLKVDGENVSVAEKRLWGVPYFQTPIDAGGHLLSCHGTASIYGPLLAAITEKWPEETTD